jgi:hypothetical protein
MPVPLLAGWGTQFSPPANLGTVTDRFIAGGPRRARQENEGFWAFLRGWIGSLFGVDRRL